MAHSFFSRIWIFSLSQPSSRFISRLLCAPSLLGTADTPTAEHTTFPCLTRGWDFGKKQLPALTQRGEGRKLWTCQALLDVAEQQFSKHPPCGAWSTRNQFCMSGWILPRSHASLSSQILGAFHLSRSFRWHRDPGSFASNEPSQGKWDLHLSLSLVSAWISPSSHFSPPYDNSLGFPFLATLIPSLSRPGCFFPACDLFALYCIFPWK